MPPLPLDMPMVPAGVNSCLPSSPTGYANGTHRGKQLPPLLSPFDYVFFPLFWQCAPHLFCGITSFLRGGGVIPNRDRPLGYLVKRFLAVSCLFWTLLYFLSTIAPPTTVAPPTDFILWVILGVAGVLTLAMVFVISFVCHRLRTKETSTGKYNRSKNIYIISPIPKYSLA